MTWSRLDEKRLRSLGGSADVQRVYGLGGKPWPRLVLGLLLTSSGGFSVVCDFRKNGSMGQWITRSIPLELLDDLQEMLAELRATPSVKG